MGTTTHKPIQLYDFAENGCPHGPEPERTTDAWDEWLTLGHEISDDGAICLSLPADEYGCEACSEEFHTTVPWEDCPERTRVRARRGSVPVPRGSHHPVPGWTGDSACFERECDDYFDADDNELPEVDACSHMKEVVTCSCRHLFEDEYDMEPCSLTKDVNNV